jgi:hypothetical protein
MGSLFAAFLGFSSDTLLSFQEDACELGCPTGFDLIESVADPGT